MVGMTIPSSSALSGADRRIVTLEVIGIRNPNLVRTGTCTMTVPYNRLSQTLQRIHRFNGKVASVTLSPASDSASAPASDSASAPAPVAAAAPPAPSRAAELHPEQKSRSSKPKRKQRR